MSDGRAIRKGMLQSARRVVVKVGSAVLADDNGLNPGVIDHLTEQLAELHRAGLELVLVSSGAVAAGRMRIKELNGNAPVTNNDLPSRQALSSVGQGLLMHAYEVAFARHGLVTAQMLLTRDGLSMRERFLNARNTLEKLLEWRAIPVINENDTVSTKELEFGDNDTLASLCLGLIGADLFINLTSADGVYDRNPEKHEDAVNLKCIENIACLDIDAMCDGKTAVGSGGMYSKLRAAHRAAQLGVPTLIVSGKEHFSLRGALEGDECGTIVLPEERTVSHKKFWLAYGGDPSGDIWLDKGAARAVTEKGKSLLPVGIRKVEGDFERGSLVRVRAPEGETLGVGLSNFSSAELELVMGRHSHELEEQLGPVTFNEAVHRDNFLLDAAL